MRFFLHGASSQRILILAENDCYIEHLKKTIKLLPAEQQIALTKEAATVFQKANRYTTTEVSLLLATDVRIRARQKKEALSDDDKRQSSIGLLTDIVEFCESFSSISVVDVSNTPVDSESEALMQSDQEMQSELKKSLLFLAKKTLDDLKKDRAPSTLETMSSVPDELTALETRITNFQLQWKLSDQDLVDGQNSEKSEN